MAIQDIIGGAGAVGNYFTGRSAMKASKEQMRRQGQYQQMANRTYAQAQPYYQAALQQYANMAGVQPGQAGTQGIAQEREFGLGGGFGDRSQQLAFRAAEEDMDRLARQRGGALQGQMARRGIASGTQAAAMGQNERFAMQDLARFRRGLAMQQGQEQERRLGLLMNAMQPAFGQGAQAANIAGQQGQYYGQQANQAFGAIGQGVSDWQQRRALQDYMAQYGVNAGGGNPYPYSQYDAPVTYGATSPVAGPPDPRLQELMYYLNSSGR